MFFRIFAYRYLFFGMQNLNKIVNKRRASLNRVELLKRRDELLRARFYYWTEIKLLRIDAAFEMLCKNEFFVQERTILNALKHMDISVYGKDFIKSCKKHYPGYVWN